MNNIVYVQNKHGKPLIPCKPRKARLLLKSGKAKIYRYEPFTIQLVFGSSGYKQESVMGIDAGSKHVGIAVTTKEGRVLYREEVDLREDITANMTARKSLRRARRNRKTRYRAARFENRRRRKAWLPPSIKARVEAHYHLAQKVSSILPVKEIVVEVGQFDVQALMNPEIEGKEYQEGEQSGYDSVREYVLQRDKYTCRYAKLRPDIPCNKRLQVDHVIPRSKGGTDKPSNLVCSCEAHNEAKGNESYKKFTGKRAPKIKDFKATVFMNVLKDHLVPKLQGIAPTRYSYGFTTRRQRNEWKLEKSHIADAIAIAANKPIEYSDNLYYTRQVRKKKRSLHEEIPRKGRKTPNISAKRNEKNTKAIHHKGLLWCLWDKVALPSMNKLGFISGFTGNYVYVQDLAGNYLQISDKYKQISVNALSLVCRNNNWVVMA
jgi:N6-L-threonylcarbamoyladenine synthase